MADFDSSLPVRTESAGDLQVKIVDSTVTSQQLTVNPDGSINTTVSATNLDIRDLTAVSDSVSISDGTDALAINADGSVNITDNGGSITVDGTVELGATSLAALENITISASDLDIRDLSHASDSVKIGDGTDFLAVNGDGSINVNVTSSVIGTPVLDFQENTSVAGGASANNDYTVTTGTTLKLNSIWASASGKMKLEVQIETGIATGVFNTKFVGFNSSSAPNIEIFPVGGITIAAGIRVRCVLTNRDNQSQNLYSTIEGSES